jgi:plastocyanin
MFLDKKRKLPQVVFLTLLTSLALLLAACQPVKMELAEDTPTVPVITPTAALIPETGVTPPVDQVPSVEVSDQEIRNGTVTVDRVFNPGPGWIVIHADEDGAPGPVIGYSPVMEVSEDVTVDIELNNATERLHAMLHRDVGTVGEYEFPGDDQPVFVEDEIVNVPFTVTSGLEEDDTAEDASAGISEVTIVDSSFQQSEITINTGTTVEWTQTGSLPHTVTADDGAFDSGTLQNGDTFQHTFDEPGRYTYHCEFHGSAGGIGMAGVIVVEDQ